MKQNLHKELNHSVPQGPEVNKQHCDEVTERHLERNGMKNKEYMFYPGLCLLCECDPLTERPVLQTTLVGRVGP